MMDKSNPQTAGRIVVADDNPDICAFISAALEGAGYEVQTAMEGWEALASMRSRPAGLLITDLFMAGQHGFETITLCKAEFPQTRIIVISAGTIPGMQHDFLAAAGHLGVAATLRKPFDADTLVTTVRKVFDARKFK